MEEKQFIIRLNGLSVGNHLYEFEVDHSFFESRDYSEVEGAEIQASIELVKQNNLMQLNFTLKGTAETACDRCTKAFSVAIDAYEEMFVKFGDPDEEHPENMLVLPHGASEIDLSQPLYEFITLALPPRRVPCEEDPAFECDYETLEKLNNISAEEPEQKPGDSIWEKLKNINNN